MKTIPTLGEILQAQGVSRRGFMKYCTALTATMGLSAAYVPKVAEVFAAPKQRPPVIWPGSGPQANHV
mgnify:CR=1 FL=1